MMSLSSKINMFSDNSWHAKPMFTAVSANSAILQCLDSGASHPHPEALPTTEVSALEASFPSHSAPAHRRAAVIGLEGPRVITRLANQRWPGTWAAGLGERGKRKVPARWDGSQGAEAHHILSKQ